MSRPYPNPHVSNTHGRHGSDNMPNMALCGSGNGVEGVGGVLRVLRFRNFKSKPQKHHNFPRAHGGRHGAWSALILLGDSTNGV